VRKLKGLKKKFQVAIEKEENRRNRDHLKVLKLFDNGKLE